MSERAIAAAICNRYRMHTGFQAISLILRAPEEMDVWMNALTEEAPKLQRPLPDNDLIAVA